MQLSADLSLYPLHDDYKHIILNYIEALERHPGIRIVKNTLSTQIFGDADTVWQAIAEVSNRSFREFGQQVLVIKIMPGDRHPDSIED